MFFTFVKGNVRLFCDGASYRRSKNTTEQWMFVERRWTLGNKKNKTCVTVDKPSMLPCMREKHHGSAKWGKEIGIVFAHITGHRIFSPQWVRHGKMGKSYVRRRLWMKCLDRLVWLIGKLRPTAHADRCRGTDWTCASSRFPAPNSALQWPNITRTSFTSSWTVV